MGQSWQPVSSRGESYAGSAPPRRNFTLLTPQFLDELRARASLSGLIGKTVPLRKAGNEFKACCPFHQEKTPSFWVNDQKGFYHCFGCGAHGDVIRFLTDARGLSFLDAVKQLADENGLDLPKPDPREQARQERAASLHEVLEAATQVYESSLASTNGTEARQYLAARNVGDEISSAFRLGYANDSRSALKQALSKYDQEQLIEAGLLISVEGKAAYSRFRNRVMVPIRDPRGRIVAFGGRILGEGEPKYLNSPDTPLFDKGRLLFNLDRAAPASRKSDRLIVVEGYFDVIALAQAGIRDAVAPMGTAITEHQLEQLWRLVDEPVLCFDGDSAGKKAAERAALRAMPVLRAGNQLRIALLPDGQDPDDLIRENGAPKFEEVLSRALPISDFLYRTERAKIDPTRPEQRATLRKSLDDLARSCEDRLVSEEFSRSFKDLFFDEFSWKKDHRAIVANASIKTSIRVAPDLARLFVRSALHGLTRYPIVALHNLEALGRISIAHPQLQRWRDAIGEAVILNPDLGDGIQEIMATRLYPEVLQFDIQHDLRFTFNDNRVSEQRVIRQLETLVQFLQQDQELSGELAECDRLAVAESGFDNYDAIEARRQRLREAKASLYARSAEWDIDLDQVQSN